MNYQKKIGRAIIKLRESKGLSQEDFALKLKIDHLDMNDIENGEGNLSLDILCKISEFFDLSFNDFIARVEEVMQYNDNNDSLKKWLIEQGYKDAILFEGPSYRNAVIGVSEDGRVIYSARIIFEDMMIDEGMDYEEALECFNDILNSLPYMGKMAPIIQHEILL